MLKKTPGVFFITQAQNAISGLLKKTRLYETLSLVFGRPPMGSIVCFFQQSMEPFSISFYGPVFGRSCTI